MQHPESVITQKYLKITSQIEYEDKIFKLIKYNNYESYQETRCQI